MKLDIEYNENDIRKLIINDLCERFNEDIGKLKIRIMVKTTMNYKAEWEDGQFKATVNQVEY